MGKGQAASILIMAVGAVLAPYTAGGSIAPKAARMKLAPKVGADDRD